VAASDCLVFASLFDGGLGGRESAVGARVVGSEGAGSLRRGSVSRTGSPGDCGRTVHSPYPRSETNTTAATIVIRVRDAFDACSAARLSRIDAKSAVHSLQVSRCRSIAVASR
jgi:hypothetical protein